VIDSPQDGPIVLIIEDFPIARENLATLLRRQGFRAETARNGSEALALLLTQLDPDVILLDMLLPELDGWRFLQEIRNSRQRSVPIIVMSGIGLSEEWAHDHDCAGFLRKPFDTTDLFEAIFHALEHPRPMERKGSRAGRYLTS
jgi:CheY-like chemotaxis protein